MSDTETDQLHQQARAAGRAGASPDFDAEHRPDVASRSSRADLKRAVGDGAKVPTDDERKAQREKATAASASGLAEAVTDAAKELMVLAHEIDAAFAAPFNEAGWEPRMQLMQSHVVTVRDRIDRLTHEIGIATSDKQSMEQITQRMAPFDRAYNVFVNSVTAASNQAQRGHQPLTIDVNRIVDQVRTLYQAHGWSAVSIMAGPHAGPSTADLNAQDDHQEILVALQSNLAALVESARLAHMSLKGVDPSVRHADICRAVDIVMVVHDLVERGDPKKMATLGKQAGTAANEIQRLLDQAQANSDARPDAKEEKADLDSLSDANIPGTITLLRHKVIHK